MNIHRICSTYIKTSRRMSILGDAGSDSNRCWLSYLRASRDRDRDMSISCNYYWSAIAECPNQIDLSWIHEHNKSSDMQWDHVLE
jgi:hypothetical protein